MSNNMPIGQITGPMIVDEGFSSTKRTDVQNMPQGLNAGMLYAVVDLGTHMESFKGAPPKPVRKIFIGFEHPQLKQLFYEDDTAVRSTVTSIESSMSLGDKSKLRAIIHAASGHALSYEQAKKYDVSKLLGNIFQVNVELNPYKDDATKFYNKVIGVFPQGQVPLPVPFECMNEYQYFFIDKDGSGKTIGNNFMTTNYAKLMPFLKKKILASVEGMEHAARGGQFAEIPKEAAAQQQAQSQPLAQALAQPQAPGAPASNGHGVTMLVNDFTLEQYLANGWTIQDLINNAKAKLNAPVAPQAPPAPQMPVAPQAPQGPPSAPQIAQAPAAFQQAPVAPVAGANFLDDDDSDVPF